MPGDFTLGCLLGQYDRVQSFDVASQALPAGGVGSWELTGVGSMAFNNATPAADTHSSQQAFFWGCGSQAAVVQALAYAYGPANDFHARKFPGLATHTFRVDYWARLGFAASSGNIYQDLNDAPGEFQRPLPHATTLQPFRDQITSITSNANDPAIRFVREGGLAETAQALYLDDVIAQINPITLYPEYEFAEMQRVIAARHRTLGGQQHVYRWDDYRVWSVPLRFLSTSHADLINWWWQNQFLLAFTLDTSDANKIFTCRIVNETQPIGNRIAPYPDLYQGVLQLEALDRGSLVF